MKKITSFAMAFLVSVLTFANGEEKSALAASSVAVTHVSGSSVFKLYYKSPQERNVKVKILNSARELIFSETISKSNGFARPYNFSGLAEGDYTVEVTDGSGKQVEKLRYHLGGLEKLIKVTKVSGEDHKYLLTVSSRQTDQITVKIYDTFGKLLMRDQYDVHGEFAQVFNLKKIDSFTIEVGDGSGLLKSITY